MITWNELLQRARAEALDRYPPLTDQLRHKLALIKPTQAIYHPALVTLRSGERRDAVYLCPAMQWFEQWGVWPEEDKGKTLVPLQEVVDLEESPSRLPRKFAEKIYSAGESGMGYHLFQITFRDRSIVPFLTGNAVDFLDLPPGKSPADIVSVAPHAGRDEPAHLGDLDYAWCLFSS